MDDRISRHFRKVFSNKKLQKEDRQKPKTSKEKEQTNYFKKSELKNQHLKIDRGFSEY